LSGVALLPSCFLRSRASRVSASLLLCSSLLLLLQLLAPAVPPLGAVPRLDAGLGRLRPTPLPFATLPEPASPAAAAAVPADDPGVWVLPAPVLRLRLGTKWSDPCFSAHAWIVGLLLSGSMTLQEVFHLLAVPRPASFSKAKGVTTRPSAMVTCTVARSS
jgi:hypothetical protein